MRRREPPPPSCRPVPREAGFTLVETLVAMFVTTLILLSVAELMITSLYVHRGAADLTETTALSAERMEQLKNTRYDLLLPGGSIAVNAAGFSENLDIDGDGVDDGSAEPPCDATIEGALDGGAERISYRVFDGELLRSVDCWNGTVWSADSTDLPMARNLLSGRPLFRYFDSDDVEIIPGGGGLTAAQRSQVRSIGIEIELEDPTVIPGKPNASFLVRTRVTLRNIE